TGRRQDPDVGIAVAIGLNRKSFTVWRNVEEFDVRLVHGDLLRVRPGRGAVTQNRYAPHVGDLPSLGIGDSLAVRGDRRLQNVDTSRHPFGGPNRRAVPIEPLLPQVARATAVRTEVNRARIGRPAWAPFLSTAVCDCVRPAVAQPEHPDARYLRRVAASLVDVGDKSPVGRP